MADDLLQTLARRLAGPEPLALCTVVGTRGSTPGKTAFRMLLAESGIIAGTIGGGCVEAEIFDQAMDCLRARRARLFTYRLTAAEAADDGLICGGAVQVLVEPLPDAPAPRAALCAVVAAAIDARAAQHPAALATCWETRPGEPAARADAARADSFGADRAVEIAAVTHAVLDADGRMLAGAAPVGGAYGGVGAETAAETSADIIGRLIVALDQRAPQLVTLPPDADGRRWTVFLDPLATGRVVILGAGHVGLSLARIAGEVGFPLVVFDDRAEFAHAGRFPGARCVVGEFDRWPELLAAHGVSALGPTDAVVVVTRGHRFDQTALAGALRTRAGYLGLIGSRTKIARIRRNLRAEGADEARLAAVHAPIGLAIGARTEAEIAVAIVAELIAVRRGAAGA